VRLPTHPATAQSSHARSTDDEILDLLRTLPVIEQQEIFSNVRARSRQRQRVLHFDEILTDPAVLAEARRLARGSGMALPEFSLLVNPYRYSSYFAHSARCTIEKMSSIDYGRVADVAEAVVTVKAKREMELHHGLIAAEFDIHVLKGELSVERRGVRARYGRGSVVTIEAHGEVLLRLRPDCWITYVDHPLTTWIILHAPKAQPKEA
jgi:hypothetical protein